VLGSPLNRVSFLRTDHVFLSSALKHPTSSFILFKNLAPLVEPTQNLGYVSYSDVKSIIGDDPFTKSEEDLIKEYNSTTYTPQLIFLGLDERKEGLVYKEHYKGAPYWALDITPKDHIVTAVNQLVENVQAKGWSFAEARGPLMSLPAQEGTPTRIPPPLPHPRLTPVLQPPSSVPRATCWTGTPRTPSARNAASQRYQ
jgi:NAD+ diphosphatase